MTDIKLFKSGTVFRINLNYKSTVINTVKDKSTNLIVYKNWQPDIKQWEYRVDTFEFIQYRIQLMKRYYNGELAEGKNK